MYEDNVFAIQVPYNEIARDAFRYQHNADRYCQGFEAKVEEPVFESRDSTPAPPAPPDVYSAHSSSDHILLTFDKMPKDLSKGWPFGTSPS